MIHPLLRHPEQQKAFDLLTAVPTGTEREWAERLGWSRDKMRRFLSALEQAGMISRTVTRYGSVVEIRGRDPDRTLTAPEPHTVRTTAAPKPPRLGSSGFRGKEPSAAGSEYSSALITAMNDALAARFKETYRRVLLDNASSIAAAEQLDQAGVPLDKAEAHLLVQCRLFNPSKHGKGELPRSLAYFQRGIIKAWKNDAQFEIPLMQLERSSNEQSPPPYQDCNAPATDHPIAPPATVDAVAQDWRAIANSPTRPRRA